MPATLNTQKYKNNIRTVSGAVTVFDDDVYLAVDTSGGACTIDLGIIPPENFSTIYKLYVFDKTGNAGTNNITLQAAGSQTVNGQSTFVVNADNGAALVRIVGTDRYSAVATFTAGALGGHVIEDEGTPLPNRPNLNFIGSGVVASDDPINNETVVDITGGILDLTNAEMLTLISTNTVRKSQLYRVTDALYTQGGVIVIGTSINSVSLEGRGLFANADFQGVGDYSNEGAGTRPNGLWDKDTSYQIDNAVVYNNKNYVSITATSVGTPPPDEPDQWNELDATLVELETGAIGNLNGYIFEVDFVLYNVATNIIMRRWDKRNNSMDYAAPKGEVSFLNFPWGNDNFTNNRFEGDALLLTELMNEPFASFKNNHIYGTVICRNVTSGSSFEENEILSAGNVNLVGDSTLGWLGSISRNILNGTLQASNVVKFQANSNTIAGGCNFVCDEVNYDPITDKNITFFNNRIENNFQVTVINADTSQFDKKFENNHLTGDSQFSINGWTDNAEFIDNFIQLNDLFEITDFNNNELQGGEKDTIIEKVISTFPVVVDFSDINNFNSGTLDLGFGNPNKWNYVGRFLCQNSTGLTVDTIENVPTNFPFELIAYSSGAPNVLTLAYTAIALAGAGQIVNNSALPIQTIFDYRADQPESIMLEQQNVLASRIFVKSYKKWL